MGDALHTERCDFEIAVDDSYVMTIAVKKYTSLKR